MRKWNRAGITLPPTSVTEPHLPALPSPCQTPASLISPALLHWAACRAEPRHTPAPTLHARSLQATQLLCSIEHPALTGMLLLLLASALSCWGQEADPFPLPALHTFTMQLLAEFNRTTVQFLGNASLDGVLTHSLQGREASQHLPLESPDQWEKTKRSLETYLSYFEDIVHLAARERNVQYPLRLHCTLGCQLFPSGTSQGFHEVSLSGEEFLIFLPQRPPNASWELQRPKENDPLGPFILKWLNSFPQTTSHLQAFLKTQCPDFMRKHPWRDSSKRRDARSHTSLVLGLTLGAFALAGLAIGIFLCTGGRT
ncbi:endothelial protein C receptor-like isoform X1 [Alligator sinensis]|uniref:Endothelial protein C receptor-like isoform X1 n=1 Tax=Alligator sinensis TaxID=38654 RepID=A0A3Q0GAC3_ALLSI|nr:endothelial protein C receptor-like isoform X1 [Alligator sinensis]